MNLCSFYHVIMCNDWQLFPWYYTVLPSQCHVPCFTVYPLACRGAIWCLVSHTCRTLLTYFPFPSLPSPSSCPWKQLVILLVRSPRNTCIACHVTSHISWRMYHLCHQAWPQEDVMAGGGGNKINFDHLDSTWPTPSKKWPELVDFFSFY